MASKPLSPDKQKLAAQEAAELERQARHRCRSPDLEDDEDDEDRRTTSWSSTTMMRTRISSSLPPAKPPARSRPSWASSSRFLSNYKRILAYRGVRRSGRDAVQRHHAAQPEVPDRRRARRGGFPGALQDPRRARGRRHLHLDRRGLVRALGCAARCLHHLRRPQAAVRARPGPAGGLFRPHQARRDPVALLGRPRGLRRLGQDLRQQRGTAVPGVDRRHHPDVLPELAARVGCAAGVSDHADRPAHPHAEGGAGQLRAEAQRKPRCSAWCRRTWRRRP